MTQFPLGRREPPDFDHVALYPLTTAPVPEGAPQPCELGCNWYTNFDQPRHDGKRYWIGLDSSFKVAANLGAIRGGHGIAIHSPKLSDLLSWWDFYNQGFEGTCVGFSESRVKTIMDRRRYEATWLYDQATLIDGFPGNEGDRSAGTSLRAGFEVLRTQGHKRIADGQVHLEDGITAYRWATSVDEVHATIQSPLADSLGAVALLNSWGRGYPHMVWMPDAILDRLLRENGEVGVVTDR